MERNSLSNELKGHSLGGRGMIENKKLVRDLWDGSSSTDHSSSPGGGRDLLGGISWPPRSYTCSFCKREFRSAQALGGHMNVHRRDKARLRQSPPKDAAHHYPFLSLNLHPNANPNPNPNPNPSPNPNTDSNPNFTSATRFPAFASSLPPLLSPSLSTLSSSSSASASPSETKKWLVNSVPIDGLSQEATDLTEMKNSKALFGVGEFEGFTKEAECKVFELEQNPEIVRLDLEIDLLSESKADLDLELRLGY